MNPRGSALHFAVSLWLVAPFAFAQGRAIGSAEAARLGELERQAVELQELIERHGRGADVSRSRWLEIDSTVHGDRSSQRQTLQLTQDEARVLRDELVRLQAKRAARNAGPAATDAPRSVPRVTVPITVARNDVEGARIHGSLDHRRVGQALLQAGIEARRELTRLSSEGRVAAAAAFEVVARERLEAARAELVLLARSGEAGLLDLFSLARCEEALGNFARADELYTEVMERDRRTESGRPAGFGSIGRAAATARAVLSWLRESGEWRPRRDVDEIVIHGR